MLASPVGYNNITIIHVAILKSKNIFYCSKSKILNYCNSQTMYVVPAPVYAETGRFASTAQWFDQWINFGAGR